MATHKTNKDAMQHVLYDTDDENMAKNLDLQHDTPLSSKICRLCDSEFDSSSEMDKHMREHHNLKPKYKCDKCDRIFAKIHAFIAHCDIHANDHNSNNESIENDNLDNKKSFSYNKIYQISCNLCKQTFNSIETLEKHKERKHTGKEYECTICNKKFIKESLYKYHLLSHDPDKKYKCKYCPKQFLQKHHLSDHERTHTGERPYLCVVCGQSYSLANALNDHLVSKHDIFPSVSYVCEECGQKFHKKHLLVRHVQQKHTSDRPFSCQYCDATFAVDHYRKMHEKRHVNPISPEGSGGKYHYNCKHCKRGFGSRYTLKNHMYNEHAIDYDEKYPCSVCDKVFPLVSTLDTHMKTHETERNYVCKECGETFRVAKNLKVHINIKHLNNKPHACNQCDKRFLYAGQLAEHMTLHTGEKPYICNVCPMAYRIKKSLIAHQMRSHTGEKPLECNYCGERFQNYQSRRYHINSKHKNEVLMNHFSKAIKKEDSTDEVEMFDGIDEENFELVEFIDGEEIEPEDLIEFD